MTVNINALINSLGKTYKEMLDAELIPYKTPPTDIGIIWREKRAPLAIVVYFTQPQQGAKVNNEVIAAAARIISQAFA